MLDVPNWKKTILEYRQQNHGKHPDFPYLSKVFNKSHKDLITFVQDSGIGPKTPIDESLEDVEGESVASLQDYVEGKCLTTLDLPLSEEDVEDIRSLRKKVSPGLAEVIAKALGVTVEELTGRS